MADRKAKGSSSRGKKGSTVASTKGVKKAGKVTVKAKVKKADKTSFPALAKLGFWQFSTSSKTFTWSENAYRFFGLKNRESLKGDLASFITLMHPEDRFSFTQSFQQAQEDTKPFTAEVRFKPTPHSLFWLEFSGNPTDEQDDTFIGTIQDVTVKKLTEFELADWKARNELVSESAGLLIYDYDLLSGYIIWSGNTKQVVGFTSKELDTVDKWESFIHEDDRVEASRMLEKAKNELRPYDVYYRFQLKDNGYCYMHDRGMFVTNAKGEPVRMLGVMADVTERIEADKTIQESEKSFRELFNSVGEAIYIQNRNGTFIDVNTGASRMYGYTKEEMIGRTPEFLSAEGRNDLERLKGQMIDALNGNPQTFEWWGKKKNGDIFLKEVNITRGTYFGAEVIIATAWDITEKMAAKKTLEESEKRFRHLIEDLNVAVLLQGPNQEVQVINKTALSLLGLTQHQTDALTLPAWETCTEDGKVLPQEHQPWNLAARTKKAVRGVVLGIRKPGGGQPVWALVNAEPTLLDQDHLLHTVITLTDITERRRIEESLKESELRFRTLQEASFGGIGLHNKGFILDCNQGLCDITGYAYEELIGMNGLDLIAPEYRDKVKEKIMSKDESPYDVEGVRKDGSRYFLEIHGKNIPYQEGLIRVTEFRNITDRKLSEAKILEQNAKLLSITENLKLKNEQLQEFTQIVSHNLRSPVGNILSLLNFIENAATEEERAEYFELLKEAGTTTLTTLNELNEVLQIKQNKNIDKQRLVFGEVFNNVKRMLNAKIAETGAEIQTDFSAAPEIDYPNIYLESIFLNLLSNALKYTYPNRRPRIVVQTVQHGPITTLSVSDNGAGLNMERYGHQVFKLRKTFHRHSESRGIGLFMIKSQIEAMGGDITMSSVEGEGSTFTINFNKRQDHEF